ncbi:hypothetical protein AGABI2DRAFT_70136 [Agaricus bisporus var. bisporus H97]|uniref:hypothetical protein n=1 Tax=Agaricus bisporus var. bisporus (strain H97 / ATCC MYA-4626 / FGSC 10389) TaxID=936046 RepID=UPI00029F4F1B|nr:hypothetical protein AGABI2DRAFT_70136 [Agaricus bisporus var. bisporus H97]EKV47615.1 hypothetical protein AGABI2DRAFT_70136 [Agaricus bisporus var. bisporus H97]
MQNVLFKWSARTWSSFASELNFFRIHVICFTITPIILAAIFYGANGRYHISYVDALYNCISSITCCGLATVNLSTMTKFQQFLLFAQLNIGNNVFISWFVVFFRRQYFKKELRHILMAAERKASLRSPVRANTKHRSWSRRMFSVFRPKLSVVLEENVERKTDRDVEGRLRTDMIRRIDDAPKPVNPSGRVVEKVSPRRTSPNDVSDENFDIVNPDQTPRSLSLVETPSEPPAGGASRVTRPFPHHQTIEFAPTPHRPKENEIQSVTVDPSSSNLSMSPDSIRSIHRPSLGRQNTLNSMQTTQSRGAGDSSDSRSRGFGGFPMPFSLLNSIVSKAFPKFKRRLSRTVTMPATTSLVTTHSAQRAPPNAKAVPYISFNTTVGRNSNFDNLTNQQLEELGGLEYRALNVLLWMIGAYYIGFQVLGVVITLPYMYQQRWRTAFDPPTNERHVTPGWFTVYQISSSLTNTGNSLVDQSVIPFQDAYLLVIVQWFLILVGNTVYVSVSVRTTLEFDELKSLEWFFFLLLDIGNAAIEAIPLNIRFSSGLFQAVAVRAAGFTIFSLADVSPAVQVLYLVMMYITICIGHSTKCSVRATNVYEERTLGLYKEDGEPEYSFDATGSNRVKIWGRYLAMHARKQLAFDIWWLTIAVFLICIIERHNITNPDRPWFNVFAIIFEVVSAYGPVGLSLGVGYDNFSLSGAFSTLSKLIVCVTMLRGRHRNLPFALDRSIMLPKEFKQTNEGDTTNDNTAQRSFGAGTGSLYSRDDNNVNVDAQLHKRVPRRESMTSSSTSESSAQNANMGNTAEV